MAHGARDPNKALFAACAKGHVDAMRQSIDEGAEVNRANNGTTPLLMACMNGHVDAARLLLDNGAAVDQTREYGSEVTTLVTTSGAASSRGNQ